MHFNEGRSDFRIAVRVRVRVRAAVRVKVRVTIMVTVTVMVRVRVSVRVVTVRCFKVGLCTSIFFGLSIATIRVGVRAARAHPQ